MLWRAAQVCSVAVLKAISKGGGTKRAGDAQGTPTQRHISPSILVYEGCVLGEAKIAHSTLNIAREGVSDRRMGKCSAARPGCAVLLSTLELGTDKTVTANSARIRQSRRTRHEEESHGQNLASASATFHKRVLETFEGVSLSLGSGKGWAM